MSATAIPQGFRALPLPIVQLSLSAVLKCGQSFRWTSFPLFSLDAEDSARQQPTHEYRFCLRDRVVCLQQSEDFLFYRSVFPEVLFDAKAQLPKGSTSVDAEKETLAFIQDYFQLDTDLLALYDSWSKSDPVFQSLRGRFGGIRMLRQDPWECLISFICSSNNNISRISKMVQNLCTHFSPPLLSMIEFQCHDRPLSTSIKSSSATTTYHSFPPPSALALPSVSSKLRTLGFGYRADFIQKTAAMLLEAHGSDDGVFTFLDGLRRADTQYAREELMKLMGVGRKVADCVLLMSLDKREVVPVDTHVHQIAIKHYGMRGSGSGKTPMTPKLYDEVNARLAKIWGAYAGWAHSILFTADLKSFATFGLPTPSPTPSPSVSSQPADSLSKTIVSPSSRKRKQTCDDVKLGKSLLIVESETLVQKVEMSMNGSLVDRIKRRCRGVTVTSEVTKEW